MKQGIVISILEKCIFSSDCFEKVIIPGSEGQMCVLQDHENMSTSLKDGEICIHCKNPTLIENRLVKEKSHGVYSVNIKGGIFTCDQLGCDVVITQIINF